MQSLKKTKNILPSHLKYVTFKTMCSKDSPSHHPPVLNSTFSFVQPQCVSKHFKNTRSKTARGKISLQSADMLEYFCVVLWRLHV